MAVDEAKETQVDPFDEKADEVLDKQEKETPSETSTEEKPEEKEGEETKDEGTDLDKKSTEETEPEVPKEFHKHPAWQRIMKERDDAKKELGAKPSLSQEQIDDVKQITSSPAFIRESMKAKGFKEEAIDGKLRELGHEVPVRKGDDFALLTEKLNLDPNTMTAEQKASVQDISKIVDVIVNDRLGKTIPNALKPLQENQDKILQTSQADKLVQQMNKVTTDEGVLDYKKDIEPALNKWLDENSNATQEDAFGAFKEISRGLTIERLKAGGRKKERDDKKGNLRQIGKQSAAQANVPKKTGDFDDDADAFLDNLGVA